MIHFDPQGKIFTLGNERFRYVFHINAAGVPAKLYFGRPISPITENEVRAASNLAGDVYAYLDTKTNEEHIFDNPYFNGQTSAVEVPPHNSFDKRNSLIAINHDDDSSVTDFRYVRHEITKGKPTFADMPYIRDEDCTAETLMVELKDSRDEIYLRCFYSVFPDVDVLIRHNEIINKTGHDIHLTRAYSLCLDLQSNDYSLISLHGTYASDREVEEQDVFHNEIVLEENAGAKGFYHNPMAMLRKHDASNDHGEVIGIGLVYSSNFKISVMGTQMETIRVLAGMSDYDFYAPIAPNETFVTPEAFLVYSSQGIDKATHGFHDLIRNHLLRKVPEGMEKIVLLNSWEGNMFDFDTDKIIASLNAAKRMGVNLFVLDDGWFRNNDTYGLGDWKLDTEKIDLKKAIDHAHALGIRFGLWVEPEQINFNSDLYREHPEYALFDPRIDHPTTLRHQFVLDMTNPEARDNVFAKIEAIFAEYELDYCKWDFNRMLTEAYSKTLDRRYQHEIYHRFVLGSYKMLDRFVKRFPNVLLETCSGGGGRFDMGMLFYSHQIWASDETDVVPRSSIQYSTNLFYPMKVIGAHVSARKLLSIKEKGALAMFGTFGYELDPCGFGQSKFDEVKIANKRFLDNHDTIFEGDYYPLMDPYKTNFVSWMCVDKSKDSAVIYFMNYRHINWRARFLKLRGLDPKKTYRNNLDGKAYPGDFYMEVGLNLSDGMPSLTPYVIELKAK